MSSVKAPTRSEQRPYWPLLALALFLASQLVGALHWHDGAADVADYDDCALCVLSTVGGAAIASSAWQPLAISLFAFILCCRCIALSRSAVRFNDSRAPPSFLI